MRIIYIGCVLSSEIFLKELLSINKAEVVGIITRKMSKINSDFVSLESIAKKHAIPCVFQEETNEDKIAEWLGTLNADIIYCFGWSYLLKTKILQTTKLGAIGYHPALLPANRGRHPIIWSLALGLKKTGSSFFFLEESADSGDIISQREIDITNEDTAATLYDKLLCVGKEQVQEFTKQLIDGTYKRLHQDRSKANEWRKRSAPDGRIDWRMPAEGIYNLVRALTHPYIGADFIYNNQEVKVWQAKVETEIMIPDNYEPGRVLDVSNNELVVKCGIGAIRLIDYSIVEIQKGECLL